MNEHVPSNVLDCRMSNIQKEPLGTKKYTIQYWKGSEMSPNSVVLRVSQLLYCLRFVLVTYWRADAFMK